MVNHAKILLASLQNSSERQAEFNVIIEQAVKDIMAKYETWNAQCCTTQGPWNDILHNIMSYTVGMARVKSVRSATNIQYLSGTLVEIINARIGTMSRWRRSFKLDRPIAAYDSDNEVLDLQAEFRTYNKYLNEVMKRYSQKKILKNKAAVVGEIKEIMDVLPRTEGGVYVLMRFLNDIAQVNQGLSTDKNAFTNVLMILMVRKAFTFSETNTTSFQAVANHCKELLRYKLGQLAATARQKIACYQVAIDELLSVDFSQGYSGVNVKKYAVLSQNAKLLKTPAKERVRPTRLDPKETITGESSGVVISGSMAGVNPSISFMAELAATLKARQTASEPVIEPSADGGVSALMEGLTVSALKKSFRRVADSTSTNISSKDSEDSKDSEESSVLDERKVMSRTLGSRIVQSPNTLVTSALGATSLNSAFAKVISKQHLGEQLDDSEEEEFGFVVPRSRPQGGRFDAIKEPSVVTTPGKIGGV